MRDLLRELLDLVLPPLCAACGGELGEALALCTRCNRALPRPGLPPASPAPLAGLSCAVLYRGDVESWIHRFKYPTRGLAGLDPGPRAVVEALVREAAVRTPGPPPDLVVPVPLHPRRLRSRGFNPAGLLARAAAREVGVRADPVALLRLRDTPSQTGLDRGARRRNVRGAFAARGRLPPSVWLVDDVTTTGSTLAECARVLRRGGAGRVVGVCAAFTPI